MKGYAERREAIYGPMRSAGVFTWDRVAGGEYALADLARISYAERRELALATEALGAIYERLAAALCNGGMGTVLQEIGIPAAMLPLLEEPLPRATVVGRFDFLRTPAGWKMIEFNADTPSGIVEAFYVNPLVCNAVGAEDPNQGCEEQLRSALRRMVADAGRPVFSALGWHEEDRGNVQYLMQLAGDAARFVPLEELRIWQDGLYAWGAQPMEVAWLFRLHPWELLAGECDVDGYPTGEQLLRLIARGKLQCWNPPAALVCQSKATQALIWGLYEAGEFFTKEELKSIAAYMLPTYLENRFYDTPCVEKPIFGREGGGVRILWPGTVAAADDSGAFVGQTRIYQQYVPMETRETETLAGRIIGQLLWGSFLVDGRAAAVLARLGGTVTDDGAFYLPVEIGR